MPPESRRRVAYAGLDFFSSCLEMLIGRADVDVVVCLTGSAPGAAANVTRLCESAGIPLRTGRPDEETLALLAAAEVDLLVSAAYPFRMPVEALQVAMAVNMHPTLLPHGRGPSPLPYLVGEGRASCGLSLHEMSATFDDGPLILQRPIALADHEGVDELALKMFAAAPMLLSDFLDRADTAFAARTPQADGSYWPALSVFSRTLNARRATVDEARALHRRFGTGGLIVRLEGHPTVEARSLTVTTCAHDFVPGRLLATMERGWIVALVDGLMWIDGGFARRPPGSSEPTAPGRAQDLADSV